ncbi:MAG: carbon monoxide dehydrogenase subunit G, partial [Conexivisphaerales archaeon]
MHFEDSFTVEAPLHDVWKFVSTPSEFVKVIPDLQSKEIKDDKNFFVSFKMGLGMIRGTVNMNFRIEEAVPEQHMKLVGKGNGLQSTADLTINLDLSPQNGVTLVKWSADLNVAGTVVSVGSRFIEPVTRSKVKEIVEGIKKEFS